MTCPGKAMNLAEAVALSQHQLGPTACVVCGYRLEIGSAVSVIPTSYARPEGAFCSVFFFACAEHDTDVITNAATESMRRAVAAGKYDPDGSAN